MNQTNQTTEELYKLDQVSVRLVRERPLMSREEINSPEAAIRLLADTFRDYDREVLGIVHLNNRNMPISMSVTSMGSLNASIASPREILKTAFLENASSIMLFHTHTAGIYPSREDVAVTKQMQELCKLCGIPLIDHVILGPEDKYYSFREKDQISLDDMRFSTNLEDIDLRAAEKAADKYRPKRSIHKALSEKKAIMSVKKQNTEKRKQEIEL